MEFSFGGKVYKTVPELVTDECDGCVFNEKEDFDCSILPALDEDVDFCLRGKTIFKEVVVAEKKVIRVHSKGMKARDFDTDTHGWTVLGELRIFKSKGSDKGDSVATYKEWTLVEVVEV